MPAPTTPRLILKDFWEDVRRALPIADTSRAALIKAQKRGDLKNLTLIGDNAGDRDDQKQSEFPISLAFRPTFVDGYNAALQWIVETSGAENYFYELPNLFGSPSLGYERQTDDTPVFFTSTLAADGGFPHLKNAGFALRVLIPSPLKTVGFFPVYTLARFGTAGDGTTGRGWQVQLKDGTLYMMRRRAAWTQEDEDDLHELEALENPTSLEQADIDTAISTLYADYTRLDLGSKDDWYNKPRLLVFIPEPRGIVNIWDGGKWVRVRHSDLLKTRRHGAVWDEGQVTIGSNGGAFFWQFGYPQFVPSGQLATAPYNTQYWQDAFDSVQYNAIAAQGDADTLPDTSLDYDNNVGTFTSQFVVDFATGNTRYTPFLYALSAYIPAGERTGADTDIWDSEDYVDSSGSGLFMEVQPQHEGEDRRKQYLLQLSDIDGATFESLGLIGTNAETYDSGAWHMCDFWEDRDGDKTISNGLVRSATAEEWANLTYNQPRSDAMGGAGSVGLVIADQWAVLDNWTITGKAIGDGLQEGAHIRQILNLPGIPASEYTGVDESAGFPCDSAIAGEDWATMPNEGTDAGSYLRKRIEEHGHGRILVHGGTGWAYIMRPSAVRVLFGEAAEFSSDVARHSAFTYPGRFTIFQDPGPSLEWNWEEYANVIELVGAEDHNGQRISQVSALGGGIVAGGVRRREHAGFPKILYRESDEWRTGDSLARVRRSLAETYFLPPVYGSFRTYYHAGLMPGDLITVDGTTARIKSISGSWMEDTMDITYREIGD